MKQLLLFGIFIFAVHFLSATDSSFYKIWIVQGSEKIEIPANEKAEIHLKPAAFKIEFLFYKSTGISGRTGFTNAEYKTPVNEAYADCEHLFACGGAEYNNNPEKDICIYGASDMSCLAWYVFDDSTSRFDPGFKTAGDSIFATRTVSQLFLYESQKHKSLKKVKEPLYFVFHNPDVEPCPKENYHIVTIPDRRYIKINFVP